MIFFDILEVIVCTDLQFNTSSIITNDDSFRMQLRSCNCPHLINGTFNGLLQSTCFVMTIYHNQNFLCIQNSSNTYGYSCLRNLIYIVIEETEDTAGSAETIKRENLKGHAAICSKYAADLYGMKVLEEGIETNKHNFTRFLVVADPWKADDLRERSKVNKANIVFSLPHNEGSLSQVLSIFSFYKINLTKIQSLPIIGREWEYLFYVDVIFNDYLRYKQSIDAVSPLTKELKILGEYAEGTSTI